MVFEQLELCHLERIAFHRNWRWKCRKQLLKTVVWYVNPFRVCRSLKSVIQRNTHIHSKLLLGSIYPTELQLNKVNTSDKETSFLDFNVKVMFIPEFTTNAMTSDFLSSISPGWVVVLLYSYRMVFTFLSWLNLLDVATAFRISILKIFKLLSNY